MKTRKNTLKQKIKAGTTRPQVSKYAAKQGRAEAKTEQVPNA